MLITHVYSGQMSQFVQDCPGFKLGVLSPGCKTSVKHYNVPVISMHNCFQKASGGVLLPL